MLARCLEGKAPFNTFRCSSGLVCENIAQPQPTVLIIDPIEAQSNHKDAELSACRLLCAFGLDQGLPEIM